MTAGQLATAQGIGRSTRGFVGLLLVAMVLAGTLTASATESSAPSAAASSMVAAASPPLVAGAPLSGVVVGDDGNPVSSACVYQEPVGLVPTIVELTSPTGFYAFERFDGPARVRIAPGCAPDSPYVEAYHDGAADADASAVVLPQPGGVVLLSTLQRYGQIVGTVTSTDSGGPLERICVSRSPSSRDIVGDVTSPSGTYVLRVPPGPTLVRFSGCVVAGFAPPSGFVVPEFWDDSVDAEGATAVLVPSGGVAFADAALEPLGDRRGSIAGVVTDAEGAVLPGACVQADAADSDFAALQRVTSSTGFYAFTGLLPDSYRLTFGPCGPGSPLATEYWDDAHDPALGQLLVLAVGENRRIDASLDQRALVSGTVTDDAGAPIGGAAVQFSTGTSTLTSSTGFYTLAVGPGPSRITFSASGFLPTVVASVLEAGSATTVDASLSRGGTISGVARLFGAPSVPVCISIHEGRSGERGFTQTSPTGFYSVSGLDTGLYRVLASSCEGGVQPEWFDDLPGTVDDIGIGDLVDAVEGETTTGIDFVLGGPRRGTITGTVTDPAGNALPDVCVQAFPLGAGTLPFARTSATGFYVLANVTADVLTQLSFGPCDPSSDLAAEFYDDAYDPALALPVAVGNGDVLDGIDAVLERSGSIAGVVTDARTGSPLAGACVSIGGPFPRSTTTSSTGFYVLSRLSPTATTLRFDGCATPGLASELYDEQPVGGTPTLVDVPSGGSLRIDEDLSPGGRITGTVVDEAGAPLRDACIRAVPALSSSTGFVDVRPSATGFYVIDGLVPGGYRVHFRDCVRNAFVAEWYDDVPGLLFDAGFGDVVEVAADADIAGIDAELRRPRSSVVGIVTNERTGAPLGDVCVSTGSAGGPTARTSTTGFYVLTGFAAPTSFVVRFQPCGPRSLGFVEEWFDDAATVADATPVFVPFDTTVRVDEDLLRPPGATGSLSGRVTDSEGEPLAGICVAAAQTLPPRITFTGPDGTYEFRGLLGQYRVRFAQCGGGSEEFAWEFSRNVLDRADATVLTVRPGSAVTGVDARLERWGEITGTVTDIATGLPIEGACVVGLTQQNEFRLAYTDADGTYVLPQVNRTGIRLAFGDCADQSRYYNEYDADAPNLDATPVRTPDPGSSVVVDAALVPVGIEQT